MKNFVQQGEVLELVAPYDVTGGAGVKVGSHFGIAVNSAVAGEAVQVKRLGVFNVEKTSAQAWAVGALVYWDDTNKAFTTTASGNTVVGVATEVAANPSDEGQVLIK